jgi:hypothetical protein
MTRSRWISMCSVSCCPSSWRVSAELLVYLGFIVLLLSNSELPHQRHR